MNFDDLKDRLITDASATWERIQESTLFNKLRDRFENMTPAMQKVTIVGGTAALTLVLLSIPYSHFNQSQEYVGDFESKRMTIRELLKVSRESKDIPEFTDSMTISALQARVESQLREANLLPEQIRETRVSANSSKLVPKNLGDSILVVSLSKINLHQVLDLGHSFQSFSSSVKLKDISITANREDNRYLDVIFKLVALSVPTLPEPASDMPPERENKKKKTNTTSEEE